MRYKQLSPSGLSLFRYFSHLQEGSRLHNSKLTAGTADLK